MSASTPLPRPSCGTQSTSHTYNTPLHVAALFQILALSTLACCFPLIARRYPKLPVPQRFLELSRHFGTGVLLATAFCHLIVTAYTSLTDPCLPPFWTKTYPAMAGFVSMCAVMAVVGVEMVFAGRGVRHDHRLDLGREDSRAEDRGWRREGRPGMDEDEDEDEQGVLLQRRTSEEQGAVKAANSTALNKPLPAVPPYEDDSDLDFDALDYTADDALSLNRPAPKNVLNGSARYAGPRIRQGYDPPAADPQKYTPPTANEQRMVLQLLLLEGGILFHSVFIGMALSVSTGPAFIVLLIAISFHQTFEGLALGSRIAAIPSFTTSSPKPWLMSLLYGITTPAGQAIGLAAHTLYDPASEAGLLTVGLVNAVSSGLLIYASLVQLISEDFLSERSYVELSGRRRLEACAAVICGSALMALVGAFA